MPQPNIILINCDDLGYGDLGCYGSRINNTPTLDRMAAEGIQFTDFYMASPVCSPSRGGMMTGCYPPRIGFGSFDGRWVLFPGQGIGLHPEEITVARLLKDRGYATKIVGKWHCGDQPEFLPTRYGFDSYYGLPYSNDMGIQARKDWPPLPLLRDEEVIQEQPDQAGLTERYVEECVRFIRENRERPFFLYFAHMHVHLPIYAPWRFLKSSINGPYGAAVECVDWSVSVLLYELKQLGLDQNTLVVFTSDNGARGDRGGSNHPLRGNKGTAWEGGLRVPCLMRWPGMIPAGQKSSEIVTSMDFLPTFAKLGGARPPEDRIIDGKDILPLMKGQPGARSPHQAFYYHHHNNLQAVRSGPWKLHIWRDGRAIQELYNLQDDCSESRNMAESHPDVVRNLEEIAAAAREDLGDAATGVTGKNCRPAGRVENPKTLTEWRLDHPYIMAIYDLPDCG